MMAATVGKRLYVDENGNVPRDQLVPGTYVYWPAIDGWWVVTPNGHEGIIKENHKVEEHEDGTITVTPSIRVVAPYMADMWHGFLRDGIWFDA